MRLLVALNGRLVGTLDRAPNGAISFAYAPDWLSDERRAIPVSLSLPLREDRYTGAEVSAYFDNLLPDNDQIRRKIAEKVGAEGVDAFNLLARIGRDCVGALQFLRDGADIPPPGPPQYAPLDEAEIADIIRNLATTPLGIQPDGEREFRISIAGAQEKTAFLWNDGWCLPQGSTPTTHIFKPQLGELPNGLDMTRSVQNEYFCLTFCRELGLDAPESQILDFEDVQVLSIKRFDRTQTTDGRLLRLPQEDFCQALSVSATLKYNKDGGPGVLECLSLLTGSDDPERDRLAFLKAQIVFWLVAATDGHAKNFSIFLFPGGRFRMTPIYDVMSVQPNCAQGRIRRNQIKLSMAIGASKHYVLNEIVPRHFAQTAKAAGISKQQIRELFHEVEQNSSDALNRAAASMPNGVSDGIIQPIREALARKLRTVRTFLDR
jgi:serine/threonine-protein kinase HipA